MRSQNKSNLPANSGGQSKTVTYKFVTGEASFVKVSDEIAAFLAECDRIEANADRKERHHCISLDATEYEGTDYSDGTTPEVLISNAHENHSLYVRVQKALSCLTETQRRRLLLYAKGKSFHDIAKREGLTTHKTVEESIKAARKKFLKNF